MTHSIYFISLYGCKLLACLSIAFTAHTIVSIITPKCKYLLSANLVFFKCLTRFEPLRLLSFYIEFLLKAQLCGLTKY